MNIFNKVALQGLLKNRTRTIVTIIGVILSAAMITGIATFATSLQNYMVNGSIMKYGDWHVGFSDVDKAFIEQQQEDDRIANTITFENIGYAALENSKNEHKPYVFIAGFDQNTYGELPITLTTGHYPENNSEIIVPSHLKENGEVSIAIGDTVTLNIGQRMQNEQSLSQYDAYQGQSETLNAQQEKTYTVVGTFSRPTFEEASAPGYTIITTAENLEETSSFSAFIKMDNPRNVHDYVDEVKQQHFMYNDNVLRFMGLSNDKTFNTLLYSVGAILVALIMLGSVFLIYNAFTISLNERMRQFGILLSVGATAKQLRNSVLFEGLCIGAVGIPLGVLVGIPTVSGVLSLVSKNFSNIAYSGVPLTLHVSMPIILIAVAISFVTILVSAYIPARKAANTPVMACIRQTNEIKVEMKEIQTSKWTEQLFGLERTLALKNFRRNKRRYRTIVLSLTLSVVMFVSASAFKTTLQQAADSSAVSTDYDLLFFSENMQEDEATQLFEKFQNVEGIYGGSYQAMMDYSTDVHVDDVTSGFRQTINAEPTNGTIDLPLDVQFLEDELYFDFLNQLGLNPAEYTGHNAKAIAVAKVLPNDATDYMDVFTKQSKLLVLTPMTNDGEQVEAHSVDMTFVETYPIDPLPKQLSEVKPYTFMVVVPYQQIEEWGLTGVPMDRGLTFQSKDTTSAVTDMGKIAQAQAISSEYTIYNANEIFEQNRNIIFIIDLFTIVFIVMISLIAIANVFNTISTNIRLRRRELAMLRSVGMSDRNFNKMMRFECALYGFQTLLFGLPISGLLAWLIYKGMSAGGADVQFKFPWMSITISIIGVFIIIFITTMYALHMIKKENIIDALRDDLN
ncbi:ABC transporter permease [Lysinibacillus sp. 2017]|uniref:ABC transporter permease n=1 Tax=unclassified Lysinibacillus TaxID=2636778 RepID=UPI000D528640|nr:MULTISPECIES: ABC transporter permease [unclassified Lysinibacillus]AWE07268.1 ABC transporter permease [Lysinibacillus sp. 2017]TGN33325.1 FtsX-like permease family protein [Lysinibacillus sp. S2017]